MDKIIKKETSQINKNLSYFYKEFEKKKYSPIIIGLIMGLGGSLLTYIARSIFGVPGTNIEENDDGYYIRFIGLSLMLGGSAKLASFFTKNKLLLIILIIPLVVFFVLVEVFILKPLINPGL